MRDFVAALFQEPFSAVAGVGRELAYFVLQPDDDVAYGTKPEFAVFDARHHYPPVVETELLSVSSRYAESAIFSDSDKAGIVSHCLEMA